MCSRAGRATSGPTTLLRSSATARRSSRVTARLSHCLGLPRPCTAQARSSGSTAAPTTASGRRTRGSPPSSAACGCLTASSSSVAVTTGRCGVATRHARCSPSRGGSMLRRLGAFPLLLAATLATTGWLYVVRLPLPGPKLGEALPLDELAKHSSAPLFWFLAVWVPAAAALALYARRAHFERLTAALLLGAGTGLVGYLQAGISIAVVRQIPLRDALDSASRLQS